MVQINIEGLSEFAAYAKERHQELIIISDVTEALDKCQSFDQAMEILHQFSSDFPGWAGIAMRGLVDALRTELCESKERFVDEYTKSLEELLHDSQQPHVVPSSECKGCDAGVAGTHPKPFYKH